MRERSPAVLPAVLAAGFVYGLWPPPAPDRGLWLGAWALSMGVLYVGLTRGFPEARDRGDRPTGRTSDPEVPVIEAWRAEVAHDVRTPLTRLRVGLERLAGTGPEGAGHAARLEAEVLRLEHLAEDLVELGVGQTALRPELMDPGDGVRRCLDRTSPVFEAAGRPVRCDIRPVRPVRVDPRFLERCLDNLLANALRHAVGEGDIAIRVAMDGPLWVRISLGNPAIRPDIPPDEWIQPFVRHGPRDADGGFGLGLAVVDRLATLQGGRLSLSYDERDGRVDASLRFPRAQGVG